MVMLYTAEIDLDTLEVETHTQEEDDYDDEYTGYAEYEEIMDGSRRVYAESLISEQDAKEIIFHYCDKFARAAEAVLK